MKALVIASVLLATTTVLPWNNNHDRKPGNALSTTTATIRLAEAKALLSKPHAKTTKNVLATADGGI